jgi:hypothetical protein
MLSLETAKSLKDAGLKWEPKMGDLFGAMKEIFRPIREWHEAGFEKFSK